MSLRIYVALALTWIAVPASAADLPFRVLSSGKVKGQVEAGLTEARDRKALSQTWSRLGLTSSVPKVNFRQRMAITWVGGGSACDKYVLRHVLENEGNVSLEIDRVRPPTGHMCIMIFSPSHIVASIPLTSKTVKFNLSDGGSVSGDTTR